MNCRGNRSASPERLSHLLLFVGLLSSLFVYLAELFLVFWSIFYLCDILSLPSVDIEVVLPCRSLVRWMECSDVMFQPIRLIDERDVIRIDVFDLRWLWEMYQIWKCILRKMFWLHFLLPDLPTELLLAILWSIQVRQYLPPSAIGLEMIFMWM